MWVIIVLNNCDKLILGKLPSCDIVYQILISSIQKPK